MWIKNWPDRESSLAKIGLLKPKLKLMSGVLHVICADWDLNSQPIAQFAITINNNIFPHIRVSNTLMRESYA